MLSDADRKLIEVAREAIARRYRRDWQEVGAALRIRSGQIFTGVNLDAYLGRMAVCAEAVALGIANRALPSERVLDHALEMARDIAAHVAPMSAALCKRLLWDSAINNYSPRQVASLETQLHHRVMGTADAREGVSAYLDRRPPRFSSRLSADWTALPDPEPEP